MTPALEKSLEQLSGIQRESVTWSDGALLVLAGPGSGKTQVLTCRIAHLLDQAPSKTFRVLALTFTNKAADEMKSRVSIFVPELQERANICTFHGFCGQVLRQHGVHVGIDPTFAIYSDNLDRADVLVSALKRASVRADVLGDSSQILGMVDRLKQNLIPPDRTEDRLPNYRHRTLMANVYHLYEDELRKLNALDFNSLIYEAFRLFSQYPAIAASYRKSHTHWLIDEFQDTNAAQYRLIRAMAGTEFRSLVAVADDDQIIYQWNGASFQQIQSFNADFSATVLQLPTNYRCPPAIVEAANRLVVYNAQRTSTKRPLEAGKTSLKFPREEHLTVRVFDNDADETEGVAAQIAERGKESWGETAVLARTKNLLDSMRSALTRHHVPSSIAQRRDDFLSAEMRWLTALLKQQQRPNDRRNMATLIEAFNRCAELEVSADQVLAEGELSEGGYMAAWLRALPSDKLTNSSHQRVKQAKQLVAAPAEYRRAMEAIVKSLDASSSGNVDLAEDLSAWREITRDLAIHLGKNPPLEQFLQELQLRSKEPTPKPGTVTLMTIHGSKGREFDIVHVIGMVEEIIPSFQSRKKGDGSAEMEEERRNCFVAITRTKECLVLSHAARYGNWPRKPSRFLLEMGLASDQAS